MNKFGVKVFVLILACIVLSGCGKSELNGHGAKTYDVTVQGAVFGGTDGDQISTQVTFDPKWVTKNKNTKYNKDLAAFAAILSDEVYFRAKDLENGTQNRVLFEGENPDDSDVTAFLKEVGFSEVQYIESYKAKEYDCDGNDSVTMLLSHGVVDGKYDLYAVVLRGCFSLQERLSVYDPGNNGESYTELTGEHPEWTNKDVFKGMDIAKGRALEFIDEFISQNDNPNLENCILITGHSRGGALAGMIGAEMEDRGNIKTYTYTFNAPRSTIDENAQEYGSIFNIFDSDDYYVNHLPFGDEEFFRYGRDMTLSIAGNNEIKAAISELKGRDDFASFDSETQEQFSSVFGQRFKSRDSLCDMKTITQTFKTEGEALARVEECRQLSGSESGLALEGLCSVSDVTIDGDNSYIVSLTYCDVAILKIFGELTAYGTPVYEAAVNLFEDDKEVCEALGIMMEHSGEIAGGHRLLNSYVLSQYVK